MKRIIALISAFAAAVGIVVSPVSADSRSFAFESQIRPNTAAVNENTDYDGEIDITLHAVKQNLSAASDSELSGKIAEGAGETTDWYAISLKRYGIGIDFSKYAENLKKKLSDDKIVGAVSMQRCALALIATEGGSAFDFAGSIVDETAGKQGIMSLVFALHLINNGARSAEFTADRLVGMITDLQRDDGGWAVAGNISDVDATAMTLQALAVYMNSRKGGTDISSNTDRALEFLSSRQLESGGFMSYGSENAESLSQVIIALCSLGIDPDGDARFAPMTGTLLSYRCSDGGFAHLNGKAESSNRTATVQALCALISVKLFHESNSAFYDFESVEDKNTAVTDDDKNKDGVDDAGTVTSKNTESVLTADSTDGGKRSEKTEKIGLKTIIIVSIVVIAAIICVVLILSGKRAAKYIAAVTAAAALLCLAAAFSNIESVEEHFAADTENLEERTEAVGFTVRCDLISNGENEDVPSDGIILNFSEMKIYDGESVLELLEESAKKAKITVIENGGYVSAIDGIAEFDYGELSGWVYFVNGSMPSVGCGEYILSDGDFVEWHYTVDLGRDIIPIYKSSGNSR